MELDIWVIDMCYLFVLYNYGVALHTSGTVLSQKLFKGKIFGLETLVQSLNAVEINMKVCFEVTVSQRFLL